MSDDIKKDKAHFVTKILFLLEDPRPDNGEDTRYLLKLAESNINSPGQLDIYHARPASEHNEAVKQLRSGAVVHLKGYLKQVQQRLYINATFIQEAKLFPTNYLGEVGNDPPKVENYMGKKVIRFSFGVHQENSEVVDWHYVILAKNQHDNFLKQHIEPGDFVSLKGTISLDSKTDQYGNAKEMRKVINSTHEVKLVKKSEKSIQIDSEQRERKSPGTQQIGQ